MFINASEAPNIPRNEAHAAHEAAQVVGWAKPGPKVRDNSKHPWDLNMAGYLILSQ